MFLGRVSKTSDQQQMGIYQQMGNLSCLLSTRHGGYNRQTPGIKRTIGWWFQFMFFHLQTWDDNSQVTFKFGPDAHSNHQVSTFSSLARSAIVVSIFSVSTMGGVIVLTARMKNNFTCDTCGSGCPTNETCHQNFGYPM